MKQLTSIFLAATFFGFSALATSPILVEDNVAPVLTSANFYEVGSVGQVLRSSHHHPYSNFKIAIPVKVGTGSACIDFTAVTVQQRKAHKVYSAVGRTSPLTEACIEIFPMPVETQLVHTMNVLTGGFVPAQPIQEELIEIKGQGKFVVRLDMGNDTVKITPVKAGR